MKKVILITTLLPLAILVTVIPAPAAVHAQQAYNDSAETTYDQSYVPCGTESNNDDVVTNPCGFKDIIGIAKRIIMGYVLAGVTFGTIAFTYAGYLYITSMGSEEKISHAHSIFYKTIWGFVFLLSSWLIAYTLEGIFLRPEFRENYSVLQPKQNNQ